jgi:DNA-binding NarL/FixJ family response regulator
MSIRLLTVDAVTMARVGYTVAVSGHPDIVLVGQAVTVGEASELARTFAPDVIVVAAFLDGADGVDLAVGLRAELPRLGVVVIGPADDDLILQTLQARLSGYVLYGDSAEVLISAVRHAAAASDSFTAPHLRAIIAARFRVDAATLSPREQTILRLLGTGATVGVVAEHLQLTESTVRTYTARIYHKLGVNDRAQALLVAAEHNLM